MFSNIYKKTNKAKYFSDLMARERIRPHLCSVHPVVPSPAVTNQAAKLVWCPNIVVQLVWCSTSMMPSEFGVWCSTSVPD